MQNLSNRTRTWGAILIIMVVVIGVMLFIISDTNESDPIEEARDAASADDVIDSQEATNALATQRDPDVPELPFDDNPDPTQCGIPVLWGDSNNQAFLTGIYNGEMIQEEVFLYDSHNRLRIVASAPHGTQVEIEMFQDNPVMNYYKVRIPNAPQGENEGWIPAAFISREPLPESS